MFTSFPLLALVFAPFKRRNSQMAVPPAAASLHMHFQSPTCLDTDDRRRVLFEELLAFFKAHAAAETFLVTRIDLTNHAASYVLDADIPALMQTVHAASSSSSSSSQNSTQQPPLQNLVPALEHAPLEAATCLAAAAHAATFAVALPRLAAVAKSTCADASRRFEALLRGAPVVPIRSIKAHAIGRLTTINGTALRVAPPRQLATTLAFRCGTCGFVQFTPLDSRRGYETPNKCHEPGCRSRTFVPDLRRAHTVDVQRVTVQELAGSDPRAEGAAPRTIEVEVVGTLVGTVEAGTVVEVCGVCEALPRNGGGNGVARRGDGCLMELHVRATSVREVGRAEHDNAAAAAAALVPHADSTNNTVAHLRAPADPRDTCPSSFPPLLERDLHFVRAFHDRFADSPGGLLKPLVHSLCPAICGHLQVKAALVLGLFGGVPKARSSSAPDKSSSSLSGAGGTSRADPHVLVVGDPGMGKSRLLRAACHRSPRGIYVCGTASSGTGLTASVGRDPVSGEACLEAGATVLADRGVCCVDEFDKMRHQHKTLLEAMEQQTVTVSKAGLSASLPSRCAIFAAANPCNGHYNRAKSVHENLKVAHNVLSRFDLAFVLIDDDGGAVAGAVGGAGAGAGGWHRDEVLMDHVMAKHRRVSHDADAGGTSRRAQASLHMPDVVEAVRAERERRGRASDAAFGLVANAAMAPVPGQDGPSLVETLAYTAEEALALRGAAAVATASGDQDAPAATNPYENLPVELYRKLVAYARRYVFPELTQGAMALLSDFYVDLRQRAAARAAAVTSGTGAAAAMSAGMPITARQLESLVRLTEARARCELRSVATEADARDAISLLSDSLYDSCVDERGCLDFGRVQAGGKSKSGRRKAFIAAMLNEVRRRELGTSAGGFRGEPQVFETNDLRNLAEGIGLVLDAGERFRDFLEMLNEGGELLKAGVGKWKLA